MKKLQSTNLPSTQFLEAVDAFKDITSGQTFESTLLSNPTLQKTFWSFCSTRLKDQLHLDADLDAFYAFLIKEDGEQLSVLVERSVTNSTLTLDAVNFSVVGSFKCNKPLYKFFNLAFASQNRWKTLLKMLETLDLAAFSNSLPSLFQAVEAVFKAESPVTNDELIELLSLVAFNESRLLGKKGVSNPKGFSLCLTRLLSSNTKSTPALTSKGKLVLWKRFFQNTAPNSLVKFPFTQLHTDLYRGFWNQMTFLSNNDKIELLKMMAEREDVFIFFSYNFTQCMINLLSWALEKPTESSFQPNSKRSFLIPLRQATREAFLRTSNLNRTAIGNESVVQVAFSKFSTFSPDSAPHFALAMLLEPDSSAVCQLFSSLIASLEAFKSLVAYTSHGNHHAVLESLFRIAGASTNDPCIKLDWYSAFVKARAIAATTNLPLFEYLDKNIKRNLKPFDIHSHYKLSLTLRNNNCKSLLHSRPHSFTSLFLQPEIGPMIKGKTLEIPPILLYKNIEINDNFISSMLNSRLTSIAMYMLVILIFVLMHRANVAVKAWKERRHIKKTQSIV